MTAGGGAGRGARGRAGEASRSVQVSVPGKGGRLRIRVRVDSWALSAAGGGARARSGTEDSASDQQRRESRRLVRADGSAGWHLQGSLGLGRRGGCGAGVLGRRAGPAPSCTRDSPAWRSAHLGRWEGLQDAAPGLSQPPPLGQGLQGDRVANMVSVVLGWAVML